MNALREKSGRLRLLLYLKQHAVALTCGFLFYVEGAFVYYETVTKSGKNLFSLFYFIFP